MGQSLQFITFGASEKEVCTQHRLAASLVPSNSSHSLILPACSKPCPLHAIICNMITKQDLEKRYSRYSISELLEIVENKHKYTDLAVVVAIEEIGRREISEEQIKSHKEEQLLAAKDKAKKNYVDRLSIWQKHFFFFVWIPLLTFPFKRNFIEGNFDTKLRQARYFSLLGFLCMLLSTFLTIEYNLSNLSFWIVLIPGFFVTLLLDPVFNPIYQIEETEETETNDGNNSNKS